MSTLTLAIDTSCDETSVSVVRGTEVLSNVLPSQIEFHAKYGGVVPSIARLAHQERIDSVVKEAVRKAQISIEDVDIIAATIGPGLAIALEVGINKAKELAKQYNKPLMTINHMEGHLLSAFAERKTQRPKSQTPKNFQFPISNFQLPTLGILVSGKHTEIILVHGIGQYEIIGETLDDACGEAFDKCGRMLGLGYPAGPVVAEFAKQHRKNMRIEQINNNKSVLIRTTNKKAGSVYELPVAMAHSGDLNFSYSGLKTAFKQVVEEKIEKSRGREIEKDILYDLCVTFEVAAFRPIEIKLEKAIQQHKPKEIWLGGGVSASTYLRTLLRRISKKHGIVLRYPQSKKFTTDNAAMIGVAANLRILNSKSKDPNNFKISNLKNVYINNFESIDRDPTLQLGE